MSRPPPRFPLSATPCPYRTLFHSQNRILAREAVLPGSMLVTVHQVHSADTVTVTAPIPEDARPSADAMVTDRPGLLLGILTADCVPVLFARSEEHTSELQSLMRISYAVLILKKKTLLTLILT